MTAVASVLLAGLTLASGQAAIQAFERPERAASAAPGEERRQDPADLDVDARHLGNHELEISAAIKDAGEPVSGAAVQAFLDMVSMPLAHTQGPIPMEPVPGEPGAYATRAKVEMVGAYDVRVQVVSPTAADGNVQVDVGAGIPQAARFPDFAPTGY